MTISFLVTNICHCAGTERAVSSVVNYIAQNGINVEIISLTSNSSDNPFFEIESSVKIHHLCIMSYEYGSIIKKIQGYFFSFWKTRSFLKRYTTDILVGTSRNTNVFAIIGRKNKLIRVVGCEHFAYYAISSRLLPIRNWFYKSLDSLVVLTNRDLNLYTKHGINSICIPNAVSFNPTFNLKNKENIALSVGRNSYEKNYERLLKLWSVIDSKEWELVLVGEGPLLQYNKGVADELGIKNVTFVPFTKEIQDYYKKASIYLMTSRYEAFPMVLIEAKTCGCACVSFDCETGPREIIRNGVDGYVIPYDNDEMFVNKVHELMTDYPHLSEMQKAAYEDSYNYSKDNILKKWLDLFNGYGNKAECE